MYFPYPGFFHKLSLSDAFLIMDDVQYDKRFTNRNKILVPQGAIWLTVPIDKDDKFKPNMNVKINNEIDWRADHRKKISTSYVNAPFFGLYSGFLEQTFSSEWELLFDLNYATTKKIMEWLGLDIPIVRESELKVSGNGTERLVNACKAIGADTYVSGRGGRDYMDEKLFERNGIKLVYQSYCPVPYRQRFSAEFVPDLSVIDLLFNMGPESAKLVRASGGEEHPKGERSTVQEVERIEAS